MGPPAHSWVDALVQARQTWWQILPLGPTGFGDSPYQCFSAFAGNLNLISPDALVQDGLLSRCDLLGETLPEGAVDFVRAGKLKARLLSRAWETFQAGKVSTFQPAFEDFCRLQAAWLNDFSFFMALKEAHGGTSWQEWPAPLRRREPAALANARSALHEQVQFHQFRQFVFFLQWQRLKRYAHEQGLRLIGDLPIFVSGDSADVWANPELFQLDEHRQPTVVAGVPPDYFSATGQRWGNPLYDWEAHRRTGYAWWVARLRAALQQVDWVRLDDFRGFYAYWEIPAESPTAENGRWVEGPGAHLLETLRKELGGLRLIAEDLGVITPQVEALRRQFDLPGMRILQFAFGGAVEERFLPHNYEHHTVVYTGTHDNDTTLGWYATLTEKERAALRRHFPMEGDPARGLVRLGSGCRWRISRWRRAGCPRLRPQGTDEPARHAVG